MPGLIHALARVMHADLAMALPLLRQQSSELLARCASTGLAAVLPATRLLHVQGREPVEAGPSQSLNPAQVKALTAMQREPRTTLLTTAIGESALGLEEGLEGNLLLHYCSPAGSLTIAGGWLGAGRRKYIWVPLRPTVAWHAPGRAPAEEAAVTLLGPAEIAVLARDLHTGLGQLGKRHAIEEFLLPDPIPPEERRAVIERYTGLMERHGWTVTLDASGARRSLRRTEQAVPGDAWLLRDREELARLEELMAQTLRGGRAGSRMLYVAK